MTQSTIPSNVIQPPSISAVNYARRGWYVFPLHSVGANGKCSCKRPDCKNQGKHPRTKNGVLDATTDIDVIQGWWKRWPTANIGISCGKSGLLVLDVDPRNGGDETLAALESQHGKLPLTPCQITGGGGQHYLFARPSVEHARSNSHPDGLDVKCDGGYIVVAPSTHASGRQYAWDAGAHPEDITLAETPTWVQARLAAGPDPGAVQSDIAPEDGYLGAAFKAAGWCGPEAGPGRIAVQCPWEDEHTSGERFDGSTVVFAPNAGCNTGHFWCSHSHCSGRKLHDVLKKLPAAAHRAARKHLGLPDNHVPPPETAPTQATGAEWEQHLRTNTEGYLTRDPGNAALLIANLPEWRNAVRLNEFTGKITWTRPAPPLPGLASPRIGDELADHHITYVMHWLSYHRRVSFSKESIQSAVEFAAQARRYNSLQDHLYSLRWDGAPRVDTWLTRYIGAEDSEYARLVGRWWLISAIARALHPGCQVDHVLVLTGAQGARKSSALIVLAGEEFVLESLPKLRDKDSMGMLRGTWIAVMNELESIRGSALSETKDFISRRVDRFRPAYGRYSVEVPRSCVFAGTSNDHDCLPDDPTGLRRWWPVAVGTIDIDALAEDRDQLWAEALQLFSAGSLWYPETSAQSQLLAPQQRDRVEEDPWTPIVQEWLEMPGRQYPGFRCTTEEILRKCIGVTADRIRRADQMRIASVMAQIGGWDRHRAMIPGAGCGRYESAPRARFWHRTGDTQWLTETATPDDDAYPT